MKTRGLTDSEYRVLAGQELTQVGRKVRRMRVLLKRAADQIWDTAGDDKDETVDLAEELYQFLGEEK